MNVRGNALQSDDQRSECAQKIALSLAERFNKWDEAAELTSELAGFQYTFLDKVEARSNGC